MPNYRRTRFEGGYYFFTLVTYRRIDLFREESARHYLKEAIYKTQSRHPFETIAFCLLYNHLHCLWKLPENNSDFSIRWSSIKGLFSRTYLKRKRMRQSVTPSRSRKGEVCIWQRRFWEHQIRDEHDLQNHINYIHYNPVKHGLVRHAEDWPWTTYHKYLKEGFYGGLDNFKTMIDVDSDSFGE